MGEPRKLIASRLPVCVYVVFHPASEEGPMLADAVYRWFRLKEGGGDGTSAGLPVYYRAAIEKHGKNGRAEISPAIKIDESHHNMVVLLVDDAMATDPAWRAALRTLVACDKQSAAAWRSASKTKRHTFSRMQLLPVMVGKSFDQLTFLSAPHNPLRIYADTDPEVPDPPKDEGDAATVAQEKQARAAILAQRIGLRSRRLRRHLTEAMVRALRERDPHAQPPRLKVFISHAKQDGVHIATRLRDGLAAVSQFEPWFDVNDLAGGRPAHGTMKDAARESSGGMIAVVTDVYPTRPWCRYEARQARTPRRLKGMPYFEVQPTVAIHVADQGWARTVAPLAQVHRIGWPTGAVVPRPTDDERQADPFSAADSDRRRLQAEELQRRHEELRVAEVVDRLLLEILLAEVMRLQGRTVTRGTKHRVFLGFLPDAWTLAGVREALGLPPARSRFTLVYPGHGLRRAEREELDTVVRVLFDGRADIVPLERLLLDGEPAKRHDRLLVAISASGVNRELWPDGVGMVHVDDLTVRLTRHLLISDHRVAYGGALQNDNSQARAIFDAAEGWRADLSFELDGSEAKRVRAGDNALRDPPVRNYVSWSRSEKVTLDLRARYLGLCGFHLIDPPVGRGETFADVAPAARAASRARYEADALTAMRERMAIDCRVRVLFGGKIHGWHGWLPGIAEELLTSVERKKPVLILGGVGGCARLVADFLRRPDADWPAALTYERELAWRLRQPAPTCHWHTGGVTEAQRQQRFDELRQGLTAYREALFTSDEALRGIARADWDAALRIRSQTAAIGLVLRALGKLR